MTSWPRRRRCRRDASVQAAGPAFGSALVVSWNWNSQSGDRSSCRRRWRSCPSARRSSEAGRRYRQECQGAASALETLTRLPFVPLTELHRADTEQVVRAVQGRDGAGGQGIDVVGGDGTLDIRSDDRVVKGHDAAADDVQTAAMSRGMTVFSAIVALTAVREPPRCIDAAARDSGIAWRSSRW